MLKSNLKLAIEWVHKQLFIRRLRKHVAKWLKMICILDSFLKLHSYTVKKGNDTYFIKWDWSIYAVSRWFVRGFSCFIVLQVPLLHILCHIMLYQHVQWLSLLHLYSHGDSIVYLLYTTSFVTLEELKISCSKASYFTAGWMMKHQH